MKKLFLFFTLVIFYYPLTAQVEADLLPYELQFSEAGNTVDSTIYGYDSLSFTKNINQLSIHEERIEFIEQQKTSNLTPGSLEFSYDISTGRKSVFADHYISFMKLHSLGGTAWSIVTRDTGLSRQSLIIGEEIIGGVAGGSINPAITMQRAGAPDGIRIGIETQYPKAKLHIPLGDIYLEGILGSGTDGGIIMKSPNGTCWKLGVSDAGAAIFTSINCPS